MKRIIFLLLTLIQVTLFAQQKTPESTELYSPVPPVVKPGENAMPPSDAVILFDGSNLDHFRNTETRLVIEISGYESYEEEIVI